MSTGRDTPFQTSTAARRARGASHVQLAVPVRTDPQSGGECGTFGVVEPDADDVPLTSLGLVGGESGDELAE